MTPFSLYERSQALVSDHLEVASARSGAVRGGRVMERVSSNPALLQDFLQDAQALLGALQDCLQHLELIGNDPDACLHLEETLDALAQRADATGLFEITHHVSSLHQLVLPACRQGSLHEDALVALGDCLTLLDWQLELVDTGTGRVHLDTAEQTLLLKALAQTLGQPLPEACVHCTLTVHPTLQHQDS